MVSRTVVFMLALITTLVLVASPAEARMRGGPGLEVGGYLFRANFDNKSNIENDDGLGARLGILFTPEHELEFSIDRVSTNDDFGGGFDVDLTTFKAGYVYNFGHSRAVMPLLTVGGGWQRVTVSDALNFNSVLTEDTDPVAFGGIGVRFLVGDTFNIRVDGQIQEVFPNGEFDNRLVDGLLSVGVGWMFGGR